MRRIAFFTLAIVMLSAAALLGACAETDVVLKYSRVSLDKLVAEFPDVTAETDNGYTISVDGETVLRVSADYSAGADDIVLLTPLKPFADAGLDVSKLSSGWSADEDTLLLTTDFGNTGKADTTAGALFAAVSANREALSYHSALDHYGITLAAGKFEFAKDYKTNDKDIVFVLKADVIAAAGADVNNIEGWSFMTMDDGAEVLVKPYELG